MDVVFLIGRILFVVPFVLSVQIHLINRDQGVQYARMYNVPLAELGVPLTGLMALGGGLSVLLGVWGDLGALLIAAFLFLITPFMLQGDAGASHRSALRALVTECRRTSEAWQ